MVKKGLTLPQKNAALVRLAVKSLLESHAERFSAGRKGRVVGSHSGCGGSRGRLQLQHGRLQGRQLLLIQPNDHAFSRDDLL